MRCGIHGTGINGQRNAVAVILEEAVLRQACDRAPTPVPIPPTTPDKSATPDVSFRTNNPYNPGTPTSRASTPSLITQSATPVRKQRQSATPVAIMVNDVPPPPPQSVLLPSQETLDRISKLLSTMETVLCAATQSYQTQFIQPQAMADEHCEPRDYLVNIVLNPPSKPPTTIRGVRLSTLQQENLMTVLLWRLHRDNPQQFGCLYLCANHPHVFWSAMMFYHTTGSTTNVDLDEDIAAIKSSHAFRCMYGTQCSIPMCPCQHAG